LGVTFPDFIQYLFAVWRSRVVSFSVCESYSVITLRSVLDVFSFVEFLKKQTMLQMSQLLDFWVVDLYFSADRFQLNYKLTSLRFKLVIFLRVLVKGGVMVPSLSPLYFSSSWLEREAWDLFGIVFSGHADLRRILTDYGFVGFPMRKDFPLSGYLECRYSSEFSKVVFEPIETVQEFRFFQFLSPWDLPG